MSQSLYKCDGCSELIQPQKARINCANCGGNHNTCTNCYVVGKYTHRHKIGHAVFVIEQSGYLPRPAPPVPPPLSQTPIISLPKRTRPSSQGGWQPLFNGSAPSSTMVGLLDAAFQRLDEDKDGLITPEEYSAFLVIQGYEPDDDTCK